MARTRQLLSKAKSAPSESAIFTNCGKADRQETPVKSKKKKLTRVPFTVSRLMEFCNRRELVDQTGHDVSEWPLVVLKEAADNSLDECEEAGVAPEIHIEVNGDKIVIADNGRGIPAKTIERVLDYSIRVSSREGACAQNAHADGLCAE
jgi:DNA topoisomerase VI subunit B